jgi:hypothetical protein
VTPQQVYVLYDPMGGPIAASERQERLSEEESRLPAEVSNHTRIDCVPYLP